MVSQDRPAPDGLPDLAIDGNLGASARIPYSPEDFRKEIRRVRRNRRVAIIIGAVLAAIVVIVLVVVVWLKLPTSLHTVAADDMSPVLEKGQVVYVQPVEAPEDDDIVAYRESNGSTQMKRALAVAGEWVNVSSDGTVLVSPVSMEGKSTSGVASADARVIASRQVPERSCFVLGDANADALEALYQTESYVPYSQLVGKVTNRVWPITAFGSV